MTLNASNWLLTRASGVAIGVGIGTAVAQTGATPTVSEASICRSITI